MAKTKTPQQNLSSFWAAFHSKSQGKVTAIFPRSLYKELLPPSAPKKSKFLPAPDSPNSPTSAHNAQESYEAAAAECRAKVRRIVAECERTNQKFTDADFDIEHDYYHNCRNGLVRAGDQPPPPPPAPGDDDAASIEDIRTDDYSIGSVHRVNWIFEKPQFTVNGYSSTDIKQGGSGDCWWLAAVATIAHRQDLMERVCVARDEECGVYGFVFQRDGEWISTVIDDNLYLHAEDFEEMAEDETYDPSGKRARRWRQREQTGSDALYFARCDDPNETWLPLLEKAYAKVHGDYESISGGYPGEAVEDMTGGVADTLASNRILRKDKLWQELLTSSRNNSGESSDGDQFVFSLGAMTKTEYYEKNGLALGHAYSVLQSREIPDEKDPDTLVRLVKIRNPWGRRNSSGLGEWEGAWSDGSKEWTPYWLSQTGHTFGDDGVFWMSFDDMLSTFAWINRTRLFDEKWTTVQRWTAVPVAWVTGYLRTKFVIEVTQPGKVVIVLAQLDERYFRGFSGGYRFELHYVLQDAKTGERLCRVRPAGRGEIRSVSCEIDLEPGRYEVIPKIAATRRRGARSIEDVVRKYAELNPQKLRQVGMQYDLAHAKGGVPDEDGVLESRKDEIKRKKAERKQFHKERRLRRKERLEQAKLERRRRRAMRRAAKLVKGAAKAIDEAAEMGSTPKNHDDAQNEKKEAEGLDGEEKPTTSGQESQAPVGTAAAPVAEPQPEPVDLPVRTKLDDEADAAPGDASDLPQVADTPAIQGEPAETKPSEAPATSVAGTPTEPTTDETKEEAPPTIEAPKPDEPLSGAPQTSTGPGPTVAPEGDKTPSVAGRHTPSATSADSASESEVESDTDSYFDNSSSPSDSESDSDESDAEAPPRKQWNAVCVIGLRVFTRDPSVTVSLIGPKDQVDTSALTVAGHAPGATM